MRRKQYKKTKVWLAALACIVLCGWGMLLYQQARGSAIPNRGDYVRLHILANSDSVEDQRVKLKVRDAVVAYITPYVTNVGSAQEAEGIIVNLQQDIVKVAQATLVENGAHYPVAIQLGTFDFPVRSYGNLVLPAGEYHAVRLLLGEASGQNWWCVLFPPLCFIDGANTALAPLSSVRESSQELKPIPEVRWKIAEFFNNY